MENTKINTNNQPIGTKLMLQSQIYDALLSVIKMIKKCEIYECPPDITPDLIISLTHLVEQLKELE